MEDDLDLGVVDIEVAFNPSSSLYPYPQRYAIEVRHVRLLSVAPIGE
jgi:hypothetical protein